MKRVAKLLWRIVQPPAGRGLRRFAAGMLIIMGLGRIGLYATVALATMLTLQQYGLLLIILGLLLAVTIPWRLHWPGRVVAALAAILMAGMAWDVGTLGVTALLETWLAYSLCGEALTSHD